MFIKKSYDHYGLTVVQDRSLEFAIAFSEEEADAAAREAIEDNLWAFNPEFVASHCTVKVPHLGSIQRELGEDAGDVYRSLIKDFDHFVKDAIAADGRGHFLSGYDGEERKLKQCDWASELREDIEDLDDDCLIYRIN